MKAFVTGSTGLLGNNLIRQLIEEGYQVKALARSPEKAAKVFQDLPVKVIAGDMLNIDAFASELEGCDVLFHCAAFFREYYQPGNHWQILEAVNIKGTVQLLVAAEQQGVGKVIYVSSSGVIGKTSTGEPSDETTPPNGNSYSNLYFKSKVLAEEAVREFLQNSQLPVSLILPGWMFGPSDIAPTDSGKMVLDFLKRQIPGIIPGAVTIVDVRDVVQAMVNAVEKGNSGDRYIVAGHFLSMKTVMSTLAKVSGVPAPQLRLPYLLLVIMGFFSEIYGRLTGKPILLSRQGIAILNAKIEISSDKAIRELDVTFRPFEDTLGDEIAWFQANQYM